MVGIGYKRIYSFLNIILVNIFFDVRCFALDAMVFKYLNLAL